MVLWKVFNDIVSNIYLLRKNNNAAILASSYDRCLILMTHDGEIIEKRKIDSPIEIDALVTIPVHEKTIDKIKYIIAGGGLRRGCIHIFNSSLTQLGRIDINRDTHTKITFLRAFDIENKDVLVIGTPKKFLFLDPQNVNILLEIKSDGIPKDALIYSSSYGTFTITAETLTKYITVYTLSSDFTDVKMIHRFNVQSNPSFIDIIPLNDTQHIFVAEKTGLISLRKLNGEKIWARRIRETIMWRRLMTHDIDNDGALEILIGCQNGENDLSRKNASTFAIFNAIDGSIKYKIFLPGWIKDFRIISLNEEKFVIIAAGKRLYSFRLSENELEEIHSCKFDKSVWRIDAIKIENKYYLCMGYIDGQIGFGSINQEGRIEL